ncbi:MAG: hypothetical protein ABR540_22620 [Acidimicrobiales bacterium]
MTDDAARVAWHEAERLLVERGSWTTDGGAYLESDEVTVLVHPVFDDADGRSLDAGTGDLVITVRPRHHRHLPAGARVRLVGPAGKARSRPMSARGQAVFRRLPAGEWTAGLLIGESASPATRDATEAEIYPLRRIPRVLPAAAGGQHPPIHEIYTSSDARLMTEVEETPEARLLVRISTAERPRGVALVRLRWAMVVPEATKEVRTVVVPLAPSEDGAALVAKYDVGSLDRVQTLEIGPAEWAEPSELTGELVRRAFEFSLYGTARRAWENLAVSGVCPAPALAALREILER